MTEELATVLLDTASRKEPADASILLFTADDNELREYAPELEGKTVFVGFYSPDAGQSISSVFGVDLSVPNGAADGRFISHPNGDSSVKMEDDLHSIIFIGVPPWDTLGDNIRAYTRKGEELEIQFIESFNEGHYEVI